MKSDRPLDNLVRRIWNTAERHPDRDALIFPEKKLKFTFLEVVQNSNGIRKNLRELGYQKSDRVLVIIPPGPLLFFSLIALFAEGMIPVLIDPRLPLSQWKLAFRKAEPKAILLPRKFRWPLFLFPKTWKLNFLVAEDLQKVSPIPMEPVPIEASDDSLITLTSGTTGEAKLIARSHSVLAYQQNLACDLLPPLNDDRHLAGYPISILQSLVEGATTYAVSPRKIKSALELLQKGHVTRLSGPPGFISQIVDLISTPQPSIQSVLLGGAPIPDWLLEKIYHAFPRAEVHVIYGATEAEPISFVDARHCLKQKRPGYLVGSMISEIQRSPLPFPLLHDPGAFEVRIQGPHIVGSEPHSTGDIATSSENGELILLGRKSEALRFENQVVMPGYLESLLEKSIPQIRRVAVLCQDRTLFVFIETFQDARNPIEALIHEQLRPYWPGSVQIRRLAKIPVDRRHLWKIDKAGLRAKYL